MQTTAGTTISVGTCFSFGNSSTFWCVTVEPLAVVTGSAIELTFISAVETVRVPAVRMACVSAVGPARVVAVG